MTLADVFFAGFILACNGWVLRYLAEMQKSRLQDQWIRDMDRLRRQARWP